MLRASSLAVARARAAVALALVLVVAGCASDDTATTTTSPPETETTEDINPEEYLLTGAEIERISSKYESRDAVVSTLEFWRAVQYQNYPAAYLRLNDEIRRAVRYKTFLNRVATARGQLFLVKPIVEDVQPTGNLTTVYLRLQKGDVFSSGDQIIGFNMSNEGGRWLIATDPYNLFRVAPS